MTAGDRRAALLAGHDVTGIDYLVVSADQRSLEVFFIGQEPPAGLSGRPDLFEISGGRRVEVWVTEVEVTGGNPSSLHLTLSGPGDASDYVLEIKQPPEPEPVLDEFFRRCTFNFKVGCAARFDCAAQPLPVPSPPPGIEVDYLAKDYASFRQALLDLIPRLSPQWTERLAADLGMTVLELLAYVADQLSYYQDAVAGEAFLETARQRVSVRRHARLVDYQMHDGASARTFVHFRLTDGQQLDVAAGRPLRLLTRIPGEFAGPVVPAARAAEAVRLADAVFETFTDGRLDHRLNEVEIHDWLGERPALPIGATTADLRGDLRDALAPGDLLLLEEIAEPATGEPAMADPGHRQVVRLTTVGPVRDNLADADLTRVTWDPADALRFTLAVRGEDGSVTAMARGNLLVADHGETVGEAGRAPDLIATGNRAARFTLEMGPLSFRPATPATGPAALLGEIDPHGATPQLDVRAGAQEWQAIPTLLRSGAFDQDVAVETGDDGRALLRFGDGVNGAEVEPGTTFDVVYRIGIGAEGNVGADAIRHVVDLGGTSLAVVEDVRNPLPAWGGVEPESIEAVRVDAPAAFRASQDRAVTEADYAAIAERHELVRRAVAWFRWTGSWHTVFLVIDPAGRHDLEPAAAVTIRRFVERFAQAGYDLEVVPPQYVPLALTLVICVDPGHFRPQVEQAVLARLTGGGYFHPDNFTFGQPVYLSRLYAAVAGVEGVSSVEAIRFGRLADDEPEDGGPLSRANLDRGAIVIGPLEVARLDNDSDFPGNGLLRLTMLGGK